jgi:hypothetical protein
LGGCAMSSQRGRIVLLGLLAVAAWRLPGAIAAEPPTDRQGRSIKELLEQATEWYDVLPDAQAKEPLRLRIVQSWQNPVRTQTGAGVVAIWTSHGRPEAMASIFQWDNDICHEFVSLSRSNKLIARDKSDVLWSPKTAGVEFHDVPEAPVPAAKGAARLRQMKTIADRFAARLPDRNIDDGNQVVLRLLPTPLYRYDLEESENGAGTLKDGAMFAFVMGTDPEVILLLEAVEREGKMAWQYAFARATGWGA